MSKYAMLISATLIIASISGCDLIKDDPPPPQIDFSCVGWKVIHLSQQDTLTEATKQQILTHNEWGARQGCWSSAS